MDQLKKELKELILEECEKDLALEKFTDDMPLIRGELDLDSLDVLQVCMAIKTEYGVRIEGSSMSRKVLKSINTLADHVDQHRKK